MNYTQLEKSHKYETIAAAIYAREVEYFHYDFDRINFEFLINNLPEGEFLSDIQNRIVETVKQMRNVAAIIDALKSQIDDPEAYANAVEITAERRKAKEA